MISDKVAEDFRENGFAVIPGFLSQEEVDDLKKATDEVVDKYCQNTPISIFGNQHRDTYFAESGDKIRGFFEEGVVDKDGLLTTDKPEDALNKIGHALHTFHPTFRQTTFSPKVKEVVEKVTRIKEPTLIQSMIIFKKPKVGGRVTPHQDATYLYTDPTPGSLIGFWIALDEATKDNGCLHFFPGSHKDGKVYQRFVRNPDKSSGTFFITRGEPVPQLPCETLVSACCKPGDLVLIDGLVIHQSEPNTSNDRRMAYTFHVVDGLVNYSPENWLQPTDQNTFEKLKDVC